MKVKKGIVFISGLTVMALGIALSTVSGLGISPLNSLAFVISSLTEIEMGYITMAMYIFYVLLEIPIKGSKFQKTDLLQIPVAILFGFLVNWTKALMSNMICSDYWQSLLCSIFSAVLIAIGTTMYIVPKAAIQAPEGLILAICERWHLKFSHVKTGFDLASVLLAAVGGLIFSGHIIGIREGTLIAAVGVGICVEISNRTLIPRLRDWCFQKEGFV